MYRIIRGANDSIETLKDSIDQREKIFVDSMDAEKAADKLNRILLEGELMWRVEECASVPSDATSTKRLHPIN